MIELRELISKNKSKLNELDYEIISYIFNNPLQISKLNLNTLALKLNITSTSLKRFLNKIELNNLNELKLLLRLSLNKRKMSININDTAYDLKECINLLDKIDFKIINTMINKAPDIIAYSDNSSLNYACKYLRSLFLDAGLLINVSEGRLETSILIPSLKENSLFIIYSDEGNDPKLIELITKLQASKIKILSITNNKNNKLALLSDINISYFNRNSKLKSFYFIINDLLFIKYLEGN